MLQVIESDRCARHKVKWVYTATETPFQVCPKCEGGKQLIEAYGIVEDAGPYIAWIQTDFGREIVEITSQPYWVVDLPYIDNWRHPRWRVDIRDPTPRMAVCSGQPVCDVRDLHPMNAATRELLQLHEGQPPSPFVTPEAP